MITNALAIIWQKFTLEIKKPTMYTVYVWDFAKQRWNWKQDFNSEFEAAEYVGELVDSGYEATLFHKSQN